MLKRWITPRKTYCIWRHSLHKDVDVQVVTVLLAGPPDTSITIMKSVLPERPGERSN
jgi:hypothetical protein